MNNKKDINMLISELNLSVRGYGCLENAGIKTVSDLVNLDMDKLSRICFKNQNTIKEIVDKIQKLGLSFREESMDLGNIDKYEYFAEYYELTEDDGDTFDYEDEDEVVQADEFDFGFGYNDSLFVAKKDISTDKRYYCCYVNDDDFGGQDLMDNYYNKVFDNLGIDLNKIQLDEDKIKIWLEDRFNEFKVDVKSNMDKKNIIIAAIDKYILNKEIYSHNNPFCNDIAYSFRDKLEEKYGNEFEDMFSEVDAVKCDINKLKSEIKNNKNYKDLVKFYEKALLFLKIEKEEIENEKTQENKGWIKDLDEMYNIINIEKTKLLTEHVDEYVDTLVDLKKFDDSNGDTILKLAEKLVEKKNLNVTDFVDNKIISSDEVFANIPIENINELFYDKFNPMDDDMNIEFINGFINVCNDICTKEDGSKYSKKEIINYLMSKYKNFNKSYNESFSGVTPDMIEDYDLENNFVPKGRR